MAGGFWWLSSSYSHTYAGRFWKLYLWVFHGLRGEHEYEPLMFALPLTTREQEMFFRARKVYPARGSVK